MLVHEDMKRDVHREAAEAINSLWRTAGYQTPTGLARLEKLYQEDVLPVACALAPDLPTPSSITELRGDIAETLRRITPADQSGPVLVVNSDPDLERQRENLDFDQRSVWRILVGGNKLARGFTVEGLTVTYYRRSAGQVDTLMQMGRWFGFRPRYQDLVRLYITPDLHDMFKAACRDEEFLRDELGRYAEPIAGSPMITPKQIPPLIAQHRPDLRPTARNKMWNARLTERSAPGEVIEPVAYPTTEKARLRNVALWLPVLGASVEDTRKFQVPGARTNYQAGVAELGHREMLALLSQLQWLIPGTFQPELQWLSGLASDQLDRWVVLQPRQISNDNDRTIDGRGPFSLFVRNPRISSTSKALNAVSEPRHRNAAKRICELPAGYPDKGADELAGARTGAILLYPAVQSAGKTAPGESGAAVAARDVTMAFSVVTPISATPRDGRLLKWTTVDSTRPAAVVIDTEDQV